MNPTALLPPFFAVMRRLSKAKIKYIVIGGVAAILHGVPRATFDLDIIIDFSSRNVKKFIKVLEEFKLVPLVPIDPNDLSDKQKRQMWIKKKNAKVINFRDLDDNYRVDVVLIYDFKKIASIELKIEEMKIPVVDKKTLIRLKRAAGRDIDLRDIKNLKEL